MSVIRVGTEVLNKKWFLLLSCMLASNLSHAAETMINEVSIVQTGSSERVIIRLNCAVKYLSHVINKAENLVTAVIEPLSICSGVDADVQTGRESFRVPASSRILEVVYDGSLEIDGYLIIRTDKSYRLAVSQENGEFRQVSIALRIPDSNFSAAAPVDALPTPTKKAVESTISVGVPTVPDRTESNDPTATDIPQQSTLSEQKSQALVAEAQTAMTAGDYARAIALYTKLLKYSDHGLHEIAQEYLGLARQRNGQTAHAKAEYEKFLKMYPKSGAWPRVRQRLAAILAGDRHNTGSSFPKNVRSTQEPSRWTFKRNFSQYYRRDIKTFDGQNKIVSQSALLSDVDLTFRRKGNRFDFQGRMATGFGFNFLPEDEGQGNLSRIGIAYVDWVDTHWQSRIRLGRQSRNRSGLLGRFDGVHLSQQLSETYKLNVVAGYPVDSSRDSFDTERFFKGISLDMGTFAENWNFSLFYNQQTIGNLEDRNAVGGEVRYADKQYSFVGFADYDVGYSRLSNAYFQGNLRFASIFSLHGLLRRSHAPFLSTRNALIGQGFVTGQSVTEFADLLSLFTEDEIRQLAIDRTASSNSFNLGFSASLTPDVQFNSDISSTRIGSTLESENIPAAPSYTTTTLATSIVASNIIKSGDVGIVSIQRGKTDSDLETNIAGGIQHEKKATTTTSFTLDYRYPLDNGVKINPRLRTEFRQFSDLDDGNRTTHSLRLRMRKRWRKYITFEIELGGEISKQKTSLTSDAAVSVDRSAYFVNLGYRYVF